MVRVLLFLFLLWPLSASGQTRAIARSGAEVDTIRITAGGGRVEIAAWAHDSIDVVLLEKPARIRTALRGNTLLIVAEEDAESFLRIRVSGRIAVIATTSIAEIAIAGSANMAELKTISGRINIRGSIDSLVASTITGAIQMLDVRVRRVKATTTTGQLHFNGILATGGALALQNHSGQIIVRLPPLLDVSVNAQSVTGQIRNSRRRGTAAPATSLTARTFSGQIVIE